MQGRLGPDLALLAMALAIDEPRLLGLAILQRGNCLLDSLDVLRVNAGHRRRAQQFVRRPADDAHA